MVKIEIKIGNKYLRNSLCNRFPWLLPCLHGINLSLRLEDGRGGRLWALARPTVRQRDASRAQSPEPRVQAGSGKLPELTLAHDLHAERPRGKEMAALMGHYQHNQHAKQRQYGGHAFASLPTISLTITVACSPASEQFPTM